MSLEIESCEFARSLKIMKRMYLYIKLDSIAETFFLHIFALHTLQINLRILRLLIYLEYLFIYWIQSASCTSTGSETVVKGVYLKRVQTFRGMKKRNYEMWVGGMMEVGLRANQIS